MIVISKTSQFHKKYFLSKGVESMTALFLSLLSVVQRRHMKASIFSVFSYLSHSVYSYNLGLPRN